jgi:L-arabinokinase
MHIAYYITGHGYGHGVRSCAIANNLSSDVRITFITSLPRSFFEEEIKRPFDYRCEQLDCGCVQLNGVTVDKKATALKYSAIAAKNRVRLSDHVSFCRAQKIDCIIGDMTPFAFDVAGTARIPSVAVGNFSWIDIYEPYAADVPEFNQILDEIRSQYSNANLLLALSPACELDGFGKRRNIPVTGRSGVSKKKEFCDLFNIDPLKSIGLIYIGEYGLDTANWQKLEKFTDWEFAGIYGIPNAPKNYHTVKKEHFRYEDLVATADCIISKLGYGVCCEGMINGVPVIFLPREDFAEYPVLEKAMLDWGHGYRLSAADFLDCKWEKELSAVRESPRPSLIENCGASMCAKEIEDFAAGLIAG